MKILLVDDEDLAPARLLRMLGAIGHTDVTQVSNASQAMEAVKNTHFDVVFLDINMPQTSGIELGYELKYLNNSLAVIFQTAYE